MNIPMLWTTWCTGGMWGYDCFIYLYLIFLRDGHVCISSAHKPTSQLVLLRCEWGEHHKSCCTTIQKSKKYIRLETLLYCYRKGTHILPSLMAHPMKQVISIYRPTVTDHLQAVKSTHIGTYIYLPSEGMYGECIYLMCCR